MARFAPIVAYVSLLLSVGMLFVFVAPLSSYGVDIKDIISLCNDGKRNFCDAIDVANQLGRLDFVSALLAVVAIFLGIAALPFAYYLQRRTQDAIEEEVEKRIEEIQHAFNQELLNFKKSSNEMHEQFEDQTANILEDTKHHSVVRLEKMLPKLVQEYMELVENSVNDFAADAIASEGYIDERS